jgi:hypothetical protein
VQGVHLQIPRKSIPHGSSWHYHYLTHDWQMALRQNDFLFKCSGITTHAGPLCPQKGDTLIPNHFLLLPQQYLLSFFPPLLGPSWPNCLRDIWDPLFHKGAASLVKSSFSATWTVVGTVDSRQCSSTLGRGR